jgi:hypothetical protein
VLHTCTHACARSFAPARSPQTHAIHHVPLGLSPPHTHKCTYTQSVSDTHARLCQVLLRACQVSQTHTQKHTTHTHTHHPQCPHQSLSLSHSLSHTHAVSLSVSHTHLCEVLFHARQVSLHTAQRALARELDALYALTVLALHLRKRESNVCVTSE